MARRKLRYESAALRKDATGVLLDVTPRRAGWKYVHFTVRRVRRGDGFAGSSRAEETCLVLLQGSCSVSWDGGRPARLGPRASVFDSYPHALYVPNGHRWELSAEEACEVAVARAPSRRRDLEPRVVRPEDCGFEIRGGGNATRQIVDILPPSFPADRLMLCEVFTPSGNWSSYPPHKHDREHPPDEVDLEEVYYYRMSDPRGYGVQRVYTRDGRTDETLKVEHGNAVLVREGYHPFVSAFGFDSYYLNVLAGDTRSMAASDDPRYAELRRAWPPPDPRLPLLAKP